MSLMQSICRTFRLCKRKNERVNSGFERMQTIQTASQMPGSNQLLPNSGASYCNEAIGNYFKNSNAAINKTGGNSVEINKWSGAVAGDLKLIGLASGANGDLAGLGALSHKQILLTIREDGEAYDVTGQKWSRS